MSKLQIELQNVIYNAAEQSFEAVAIVHDGTRRVSMPCAIAAPLDMSFEDAARALSAQALDKHGAPGVLQSYVSHLKVPRQDRRTNVQKRRGLPIGQYGFFRGRAA